MFSDTNITWIINSRFPDEDAGEIPMAFIVRKPGSNINEAQIIDFVAKQVMLSALVIFSVPTFYYK